LFFDDPREDGAGKDTVFIYNPEDEFEGVDFEELLHFDSFWVKNSAEAYIPSKARPTEVNLEEARKFMDDCLLTGRLQEVKLQTIWHQALYLKAVVDHVHKAGCDAVEWQNIFKRQTAELTEALTALEAQFVANRDESARAAQDKETLAEALKGAKLQIKEGKSKLRKLGEAYEQLRRQVREYGGLDPGSGLSRITEPDSPDRSLPPRELWNAMSPVSPMSSGPLVRENLGYIADARTLPTWQNQTDRGQLSQRSQQLVINSGGPRAKILSGILPSDFTEWEKSAKEHENRTTGYTWFGHIETDLILKIQELIQDHAEEYQLADHEVSGWNHLPLKDFMRIIRTIQNVREDGRQIQATTALGQIQARVKEWTPSLALSDAPHREALDKLRKITEDAVRLGVSEADLKPQVKAVTKKLNDSLSSEAWLLAGTCQIQYNAQPFSTMTEVAEFYKATFLEYIRQMRKTGPYVEEALP
jgi:hypothetical protein